MQRDVTPEEEAVLDEMKRWASSDMASAEGLAPDAPLRRALNRYYRMFDRRTPLERAQARIAELEKESNRLRYLYARQSEATKALVGLVKFNDGSRCWWCHKEMVSGHEANCHRTVVLAMPAVVEATR